MKFNIKGKIIYTKYKNKERKWDPKHSKLAAAILNGMKATFEKDSKILYLGASTGTTVSHLSDIITEGIIYGVEFSERVFRSFMNLSQERNNIVPMFFDARFPEKYNWVEECDVVFCDIAQPDQTEIAIRNIKTFLKRGGFFMISIKSQSIDVTKDPKQVYKQEAEKIKKAGFEVTETINLEPFEEKHSMIIGKK
ncbi:fibrillarin-like rRNA/tRNA 2'-O-methyltransferase [Candidatus Aenigmatarchaeota archaeon]